MNLRAHKLTLRDILSFESLEIEFGDPLTIVRAHNGAGKSNITNAITSLIDGGMDATLIRAGQPDGEAVWILSEDGKPWTLHQRLDRDTGAHRHVIRPDGTKDNAAKRFIYSITNSMSANPIRFVTASPSERARAFLDQMPVRLTPNHLQRIGVQSRQELLDRHGLLALRTLDKEIRATRESHGRDGRQAKDAAEKLKEALPPGNDNVDSALAAAREQHNRLSRELSTQAERLTVEQNAKRQAIASRCANQRSEIDAEIAKLEARRRELDLAEKVEIAAVNQQVWEAQAAIEGKLNQEILTAADAVRSLERERDEQVKAAGTRAYIAEYEVLAQDHRDKWRFLAEKLEAIEAIEKELLDDLPIKNVQAVDGELYRDGVPFPRWNEQAQWALALQMAKMSAGDLKFCVIDGINFLDPANRAAFHRAAVNSGMQFLITEVNQDCQCGHPSSVHEPACRFEGCECDGYIDPGMVIERVGGVPPIVSRDDKRKRSE